MRAEDRLRPSQIPFILAMWHGIPIFALLAIGPLIDRFGPRKIMLMGLPLAGVGFGCMGLADHIFALFIPPGLISLGMATSLLLPVQTAVANWFAQNRTIALTALSVAAMLGGGLVTLLGEGTQVQWTWPNPFLWLGMTFLIIGIPLALFIRHRPEPSGYLPDGKRVGMEMGNSRLSRSDHPAEEVAFTWRQALRTRTLWMLSLAGSLTGGFGTVKTILIHQQEIDLEAIHMTEIATLSSLLSLLVLGYLGDRYSKRKLLALVAVCQSAGLIILMMAEGRTPLIHLYAILSGLGLK